MSDISIREIQEKQAQEWDEFVAHSPQGSIFTDFAWKKIIDTGSFFTRRIFGVFEKDRIQAGVVLTEKRQLGKPVALSSLLTPYPGFLVSETGTTKTSDRTSREHRFLGALCDFLEKKYTQIDLNNSPLLTDMRPFIQKGWKPAPRYTCHLRLEDIDALWKNFDGSVRRAVKKTGRSDLKKAVMNCTPDEVYSLLDRTLTRHGGRNPIPLSLVKSVMTNPAIAEQRVFLGARNENKDLVSVIVSVWDDHRAYYLIAATNPDYLKTGINSGLVWELCRHLSLKGIPILDFMGANIPGIAKFKETFNPEIVQYYRLYKWPSPLFRIMKKTGQFLLRRRTS